MLWRVRLDRQTLPLKRMIANLTAPDPDRLGHPLFSTMIKDRIRRWQTDRQPNPYSPIASKVNGQTYMQSLGHAVPQVYGVYPDLDAIPRFEDLPANFVLKPVNGWSATGVYLMRGGVDWFSKRRLSRDDLIKAARSLTAPGHTAVTGAWMAEELLLGFDGRGEPAPDVKFYCFGQKVAAIHIVSRISPQPWENQNWFVDPDLRPLPFRLKWSAYPDPSPPPRPPFFHDMLSIASDVAAGLDIFVRIDMYATDRGPVFGEFTGYPSSGRNYTPRGDAWLGSHWKSRDGGSKRPAAPPTGAVGAVPQD